MAVQVNIAEAKAKLSSLLDQALAGEEVVSPSHTVRRRGQFSRASYGDIGETTARITRQAVDRGASVSEHEWRSRAGVL